MAKIRRIVRKLAPAGRSFDEQLWPVYLSLLVLGGLLCGAAIGYFRWDDMWQRLALVFSLLLVPFAIGMAMMVLALMDSRKLNQRTLLSLVLALICTFTFFAGSKFVDAIQYIQVALTSGAEQPKKPPKVIPEYHEFQLNPKDKPKQDFQKPVETKVLEPEPEEVQRQETEPEEAKPKPEKVEVEQPKEEVEPNAVERKIVEQTAPRRSEQQSKLSRQTTQFKPNAATPAATVKVDAAQQKVDVQAKSTAVARQTNQAQSSKTAATEEPTTKTEAKEVEITRRETTTDQVAQSSTAPTLQRKLEQPKALPQTNAVAEQVTAPVAQQTNPSAVKPNTTAAEKQQTTSTEVAAKPTEPTPDTPAKVAQAKPLTRQQSPDRMPNLAQSSKPVPSRRTPTTTLPQASAVATAQPTTTSSTQPTPREVVKPSDATVARTSSATPTPSRAPQPTDAPQQSQPVEIAQANNTRAQSSEVPTANPQATPTRSVSRTPAQSSAEVPVRAQAVQVAAAQPVESLNSPRAAGVSVSKQQTSTSAVARATADPSPDVPTAVTEVSNTPQSRQQAAQPSPVMAQTSAPVLQRLAPSTSNPSPSAVAAAVTTPTQSPVKSDSPSPAPSASTVARQTSQSNSNTSSPRAMESPTKSPSTELARANEPGDDLRHADDSPHVQSHQLARPFGEHGRLGRFTGGEGGAGGGDFGADNEQPGGRADSPGAQSGGLQRHGGRGAHEEHGPQFAGPGQQPRGDRLRVGPPGGSDAANGSRAGAVAQRPVPHRPFASGGERPSATLVAQELENATVAGAQQAAELDASSSAAIERQAADAVAGDVTASSGEIEVDVGPTKIVSENSTGKAAGGGQPTLNFETRSNQIQRADSGGAMELALAEAKVEPVAQAEPGSGGGEPSTPDVSPEATAVVRTEEGGASPATGGPAAMDRDPSSESASSQQVAEAKIGRAETIEAVKAEPTPGGGSSSPAKSATGPKLAANLIAAAATPSDTANPPQGTPDGSPPTPSKVEVARADASGGAPTAGGPAKADEVGPTEDEKGEPSNVEIALAESSLGRATSIESTVGKPKAGGGTSSPTRQSTGPAFTTTTKAEQVALAGTPDSSGIPQGSSIEAQGADAVRAAAGVAGKASGEAAGALAAAEVMDAPATGEPGSSPGSGRAKPQAADGPEVGPALASGGPFKKSSDFAPPGGGAEQIAMADAGGGSPAGQPDVEAMMSGMDSAGMSRQVAGGLPVEVSAHRRAGRIGDGSGAGRRDDEPPRPGRESRGSLSRSPFRSHANGRAAIAQPGRRPGDEGVQRTEQVQEQRPGRGGRQQPAAAEDGESD